MSEHLILAADGNNLMIFVFFVVVVFAFILFAIFAFCLVLALRHVKRAFSADAGDGCCKCDAATRMSCAPHTLEGPCESDVQDVTFESLVPDANRRGHDSKSAAG